MLKGIFSVSKIEILNMEHIMTCHIILLFHRRESGDTVSIVQHDVYLYRGFSETDVRLTRRAFKEPRHIDPR